MFVIKRNGNKVPFDKSRISGAIGKAARAVGRKVDIKKITDDVVSRLKETKKEKIDIEVIQDKVEESLMKYGYPEVARAYITYRDRRADTRRIKKFLGVEDDLKLSVNAIVVLEKRYLQKNERGEIIETPGKLFKRVAKAIADIDRSYNEPAADQYEEQYYRVMRQLKFLPNSPTLMNAGTRLGQLSACFVVPVEDSLNKIFDALKAMALIQKSGGGTGFSFSNLRPKGDMVASTHGIASGPVSFMKIFDTTTDVIKQGGKRRGANMGILRSNHPDIFDFVNCKVKEGGFSNFNISIAATDNFMKAVNTNDKYPLINPHSGKKEREINARDLFDVAVTNAWKTGDPGIVFIDEINRHNPTPQIGNIESTNPCGEQPLLPFESCNLGSIDVSKFVKDKKPDYKALKETIKIATRFLDNVIDANKYPLPEIEKITRRNRKIGLGIMGFAEALIKMEIPYDSREALKIADKLSGFLTEQARKTSHEIAKKRGAFPNYKGSVWDAENYPILRNATVTTIAPTGTISIIAGTSSGIEPLFSISFVRNVLEGTKLLEVNPQFEKTAIKKGFYSKDLMLEIARKGSISEISQIPKSVREVFRTALDIDPLFHVKMQAAFQKNIDNAVSKTVNLPENSTPNKVREIFLLAHKLNCKGITVYRYGSRKDQVLQLASRKKERKQISADVEYSGGCPLNTCNF